MITFRSLKGFFDAVYNADTVGQLKNMRQVIDDNIVIMEQKENVAKDQTNVTDSTILDFGLSKEQLYGKYVYVPSKEVGDKIKKIAEELGFKPYVGGPIMDYVLHFMDDYTQKYSDINYVKINNGTDEISIEDICGHNVSYDKEM